MFNVHNQRGSALVVISVLIFCVVILSANLGQFVGNGAVNDIRQSLELDRQNVLRLMRSLLGNKQLCTEIIRLNNNKVDQSLLPVISGRVSVGAPRVELSRFVLSDVQAVDFVYDINCPSGKSNEWCQGQDRIPLLVQWDADHTKFSSCSNAIDEKTCSQFGGKWQISAHNCDVCPGKWENGFCS